MKHFSGILGRQAWTDSNDEEFVELLMHKVDGVDNIKDSHGKLGRQTWTEMLECCEIFDG